MIPIIYNICNTLFGIHLFYLGKRTFFLFVFVNIVMSIPFGGDLR